MATIGTFTHDRDGFLVGSIRTLTLDTPAQMEPIASDTQGAPAYRLYAGEVELGAAWAKTARESGRAYHQVRLDDPSFPAPIFANLIADESAGTYSLVWNRPKSAQKGRGGWSAGSDEPAAKRRPARGAVGARR